MMVITEVAKIVVRQGGVKRRDLIAETNRNLSLQEDYKSRDTTERGNDRSKWARKLLHG